MNDLISRKELLDIIGDNPRYLTADYVCSIINSMPAVDIEQPQPRDELRAWIEHIGAGAIGQALSILTTRIENLERKG